ncbi:hypothetical protein ACQJBY_027073 [Aegilops geniculata]
MDAYAKCGFAELGYLVFRQIPNKNSVMYNMVISNLGSHGFLMKVIEVHAEMIRDKLRPDGATFSALLAACCHAGILNEGWKLFRRMRDEFHILVEMQHYVYILVATFNQLKEAYNLTQQCQCQQIVACGVHYFGGVVPIVIPALVVGRAVAEKLFEFYPDKASYKIMLSNLYASHEIWFDEDINTIVTPTAPTVTYTGPITRARARQLNYQVLSFLGNDSNVHENMILPKLDTFVLLTNEGPSLEKDGHWSKNTHGVDGMRKGIKNGVISDDFRTLKPP